ncbi:peroxiredoxin family protein [Petrocella sp. FN5]|uniref:peroxiredoxin family protein n=1 Tax=Petrocella sp. FN5 TaxID=3032002 RepID=UPI0023D9B598|nr:redoxin domain-containing protein [Petrocella sp. FN5]MDF1618421.1 redoxin domain-containing protein [Petrocella sp. FN5]
MIKENSKANLFVAEDLFGNKISLEAYKGKKILLSFFRYASCPLCNLRVQELIRNQQLFKERGLEILAVFQSPKDSLLQYVGKQNAPFPIITDPEERLYKLYQVEASAFGMMKAMFKPGKFVQAAKAGFIPGKGEGSKTRIPADFLIDQNLKIAKAYYGKDIGDHMPLNTIFEFLKP